MKSPLPVFVEVILPLALVWGAGFAGRRWLRLSPQPLARLGLYLLTAPLIFKSLLESSIQAKEAGRILLLVVLLAGLLWLLAIAVARLLRLSPEDSSALALVSMLINTVNYGFPVTLLALGQVGLDRAVVFAVGHAVLGNTVGAYIAARGRAGGARQALGQVLRIPMLYAVLLALICRATGFTFEGAISLGDVQIALWPSVYKAVELLAQGSIPIFLLVLGMQLGNGAVFAGDPAERPLLVPMLLAGGLRLVVSPLLAWGLTWLLGLSGVAAQAAILEAAMPSAVLTVILSTEFNVQPRFVTAVVVGTTLCSIVSLTVLLSLW
ncbi:MAG: AEC family transporter [Chloroflexia bacterium]|nr:AEC family transporter [Chloroflexia bacterium]